MRTLISLAALFGFALSLDAQINAVLNRLSDGSIEVRVRNDAAVSSTAFAFKVDHANRSGEADTRRVVYLDPDTVDTATDTTLQALQPNQEHSFKPRLGSRSGGPAPVT